MKLLSFNWKYFRIENIVWWASEQVWNIKLFVIILVCSDLFIWDKHSDISIKWLSCESTKAYWSSCRGVGRGYDNQTKYTCTGILSACYWTQCWSYCCLWGFQLFRLSTEWRRFADVDLFFYFFKDKFYHLDDSYHRFTLQSHVCKSGMLKLDSSWFWNASF